MIMLKPVLLFLLLQLILGLVIFHPAFLISETSSDNSVSGIELKKDFSKKFYRLEYSLLNKQINYPVTDSIFSLDNDFEKDYLLALDKKRKAKYSDSFNQLYAYLPNFPMHYQYYDELIFTAKASGNVEKIENFIAKTKPNKNSCYHYLSALINYHSNKYSDAIKVLDGKDNFNMLYLLSFAYRGLGDYQKSLDVLQKCELKIGKDDSNLPKVLVAEGSIYLLSGDYPNANRIYQEALQLSEKSGNQKEKAKVLINLAIIDDQNGKTDESRKKLQSALDISRLIESQDIEATVLSELGVSYTYTNEKINARDNYEKSFDLNKVLNNKERLSNLSANIAAVYAQQANYNLALKFYSDGLSYAGENIFSKILNLRGLGDVNANVSNYSDALNYYAQAKELAKQIKNINSEADIDISIGTLYYNISKPYKALEIFLDAKKNLGQNADLQVNQDLDFKTGLAYSAVDSMDKGNEYLNEGMNIAQSVGDIYNKLLISTELAYNSYVHKKYQNAEKDLLLLAKKSEQAGIIQLQSLQYLYLGKINFDQNNRIKAISFFEHAIKLAQSIKDFNTLLSAEFLSGKCYESAGNLQEAESKYISAINMTDKISESLIDNSEIQIAHFAGLNEPYIALAELYLKQERDEEAFSVVEKSRSRNTFQNLNNLLISSKIHDEKLLRQYYDLGWKINSGLFSDDRLEKLKNEYKLLTNRYFITDVDKGKLFSLKEIQKGIGEKENLITIFFGDSSLFVFYISAKEFKVNKIDITRIQIQKMMSSITSMYSGIAGIDNIYLNQDLFSFNAKASNEFYNLILKNVMSSIPPNEKVIFSLPAEMSFIPLEFLVTDFENEDSPFYYNNKKFLIEKYPVSYTPSVSIYMLQKKAKKSQNKNMLLVGDPLIDNKDFAASYRGGLLEDNSFKANGIVLYPLKYSQQEVKKISELFSNTSVLLSEDATEQKFKDNAINSNVIHLSTHSFLYKDQPLIIFSQSKNNREDGYLEGSEIISLKLNSDLIVLSSCKSGIGSVDKAEGVIGMQKSFFEAGAKSVVVSLWDVNDKYTSLFMQSFYKFLSDGYDKSEALRQAKIFFKKNYSANPYYWAAFVLSGNISPIEISKENHISTISIILFFTLIAVLFTVYLRKKYA